MILTSTNEIKNYKIINYLGLINVNLVIGANFFSDFFASFSDVFGGYSGSYQSRLDKIYNDAIRELQNKAQEKGANAIIGVHFDFDEVSGKGKSMFMITAYGTAVNIEKIIEEKRKTERYEIYEKLYNLSLFKEKGIITSEQYEAEKNNLLLSYEEGIKKELDEIKSENDYKASIKQAQELARKREEERQKELELAKERQRIEAEAKMTEQERLVLKRKNMEQDINEAYEQFKVKAPSIIIKVRELLVNNVDSPHNELERLTNSEISNANYDELYRYITDQAAQTIAQFIKIGKVAEACKYYIDLVGDNDVDEAKSYVSSVYDMITFKDQRAFVNMAKNLVELKCLGEHEQAALVFSQYAVCDLDTARQIVNML